MLCVPIQALVFTIMVGISLGCGEYVRFLTIKILKLLDVV